MMSAQFPSTPGVERGRPVEGSQIIGLVPVKDTRTSTDAGSIGAAGVRVGPELADYVHRAFRVKLGALGLNAVSAPDPTALPSTGTQLFSGKVIVVTVQSASIGTADAILFPADASVAIAVQVFDSSARPLYANTYSGNYSERVGMHLTATGYGDAAGAVIARAADQAVGRATTDSKFADAVR